MKPLRETIADILPLATPLAILSGLALVGGGFDLAGRHSGGILAWVLVAVLLISPYRNGVRFARPFLPIAGLLAALAVFAAVSSVWSSSTSGSLEEASRVVAYLGFFTAAYLVCQTSRQRQKFVEGLFLGIAFIIVLAIADRCFPGTEIPPINETARQRFPLGYWNANGAICGIGILFFAWMNRAGSSAWLRWLAAALIPVAIVTLYLTYSRGGLVVGLIALVSMFFLSRHRLRFVAVLGAGSLVALPVLLVVGRNPTIAENLGGPDAPAEGRAVALALIASMLASALLIRALMAAASRYPGWSRRAVEASRDGRILKGIAASGTAALLVLAILFGGHAWSQFSGQGFSFPDDPKLHFTQLTGAGRYDFSQVAVEALSENPLTGTGAGTYRFEWAQNRDNDLVAQDAHSLYFEAFAELGLAGGTLVLVLIISLVWIGARAWRLAPRDEHDHSALLLSAMLAIVFALGIDWTWEMAATASLFMIISACLAASLQSYQQGETVLKVHRRAGKGQMVLALAAAWLAIVLLAVPLAADRYMSSSAAAAADGRLEDSVRDARRASDLEPWSPAPHLQLGVIAQSLGLYDVARAEYARAARLEPENWQPPYLKSLLEFERGDPEAAARDLDVAFRLNPRSLDVNAQREILDAALAGD